MDDPENRECTFAPVVQNTNSARKNDDNVSSNRGGVHNSANKWEELY